MKHNEPSSPRLRIEIEIGGTTYHGTHFTQDGMITVEGPQGMSKRTQVGGLPAPTLARQLLSEIARGV